MSTTLQDRIRWFARPADLREALVKVISTGQQDAPEVQVLGAAAATVLLADAIGMDPHDLVTRINRMKADVEHPFARQWQAMTEYAQRELMK